MTSLTPISAAPTTTCPPTASFPKFYISRTAPLNQPYIFLVNYLFSKNELLNIINFILLNATSTINIKLYMNLPTFSFDLKHETCAIPAIHGKDFTIVMS